MSPLAPEDLEKIDRVVHLMESARHLLFITGAGLSADSGLPTYWGIGGLYEDMSLEEGIPIEVALSGQMMRSDPALCWKYIAQVERACRGARPNRGHEVIAEMERHFERVCVLTQNVDGFHRAAGSRNVVEIHGRIQELSCTGCGRRTDVNDFSELQIPPRCPDCGSVLRPEVVLFGEMLPLDQYGRLHAELRHGFDLIFTVGTRSSFPYIAQPIYEAKLAGFPTVEINPGPTEVSHLVDIQLQSKAAETLEAIWSRYRARR